MGKAVWIVVVMVVAGALFYFFDPLGVFKPSLTFSEGFQELKGYWEKHGLDARALNEIEAKDISEGQLDALENDLEAFKSGLQGVNETGNIKALKELAGIQLNFVGQLKQAKDVDESVAEFNSVPVTDETVCGRLDELELIQAKTESLFEAIKFLGLEVQGFVSEYPSGAEESGLNNYNFDNSSLQEEIFKSQEALTELEKLCA